MSTRCQVKIEGNQALLYIHADGSPESILPTLMPFVEKFKKARGSDPKYMLARMVQVFTNEADKEQEEFLAKMKEKPSPFSNMTASDFGSGMLGFGVCTDIHGDIEFLYVVSKTCAVEVRKVSGFGEDQQSFDTIGHFPIGTSVVDALKVCKAHE